MKRQALLLTIILCSASLAQAGSIVAWGYDDERVNNVPDGNDFIKVEAGGSHSLALREDGSLVAWGCIYQNGQCDVPSGNDFIDIAAGEHHSLAQKSDGTLVTWGNDEASLEVPDGNDFIAIAAGGNTNMAIKPDGTIDVRSYYSGESGIIYPPEGETFTAVSTSYWRHAVALISDGTAYAWGEWPQIPDGNDLIAVSAGSYYSLGLREDGSLVAAGKDINNQLNVPAGNDYIAISAGRYGGYAIKEDRTIVAWGDGEEIPLTPTDSGYTSISLGVRHVVAIKEPICTEYPTMDFNLDCKVDLLDFAEFISQWLDCNLDPPSACWE